MSSSAISGLRRLEVDVADIGPKTLLMVYSPRCPACKSAAPEYLDAAKRINRIRGLKAQTVSIDARPTIPVRSVPTFYASDASGKLHVMDRRLKRDAPTFMKHLLQTCRQKGLRGGADVVSSWNPLANLSRYFGPGEREAERRQIEGPGLVEQGMTALVQGLRDGYKYLSGHVERDTTHVPLRLSDLVLTSTERKRGRDINREQISKAMREARILILKLKMAGIPPELIAKRIPSLKPILQETGDLPLSPVRTPKEDLIAKLVVQSKRRNSKAKRDAARLARGKTVSPRSSQKRKSRTRGEALVSALVRPSAKRSRSPSAGRSPTPRSAKGMIDKILAKSGSRAGHQGGRILEALRAVSRSKGSARSRQPRGRAKKPSTKSLIKKLHSL